MDNERHLDCDVSSTKKFISGLQRFGVRFSCVYLDWMWTPSEWWRHHVKPSFFQKTLPAMVQNKLLRAGATVYVPFTPYTLACLTRPSPGKLSISDTLNFNFRGEFLTESNLRDHELWNVTQNCDRNQFHRAFGKHIDASTTEYIQFDQQHFDALCPEAGSTELKSLLTKIRRHYNLPDIRFIKLTVQPSMRKSIFGSYQ